jgi:ferredoxin
MTKHVVIVGSGPSALATAKTLIASPHKFQITVVDAMAKSKQQLKVGLKSHFGSTDFYDTTESDIIHRNMKPVIWPSSGKGGFSRIWGAAVGEMPSDNFPRYLEYKLSDGFNPFSTKSAICIKKRYLKNKKPKWEVINHVLAVDPKKCIKCGDCLTGCPTDAIWFAGDEWKTIEKNIVFHEDFRVNRLEPIGNRVALISKSGERLVSDYIFLAAGTIATSQILMRSEMIEKKITIRDTASTFFPALRLPIIEGYAKFSLSQISAKIKIGENKQNYIQIYPDSRMLADPIIKHKPKLGFIVKRTWRMISPFMLSIILYENTSESPKIELAIKDDGKFELSKLEVQRDHRLAMSKMLSYYYIFRDFGILPLVFLGKKGEAGESYHFGSVDEIIGKFNYLASNSIRIVDASILSTIEPGPITDKVMTNASQIVTDFLREYDEIPN